MAGRDQVVRYNHGLIVAPKASVFFYDRFNSEVRILIAQMEPSNLSPLRDAGRRNEHRTAANRRDHLLGAVHLPQKRQDLSSSARIAGLFAPPGTSAPM